MSLYFTVCIVQRSRFSALAEVMKKRSVPFHMVSLGRGTANGELLNLMGLEDAEKAASFSVMTESIWKGVKKDLQRELQIDVPGTGIAFTVPLSSVGGKTALRVLTHRTDYERTEESELKNTEHELILAICEQGYSQKVMDAAKKGGAGGGTVIRARGTGVHAAEQFLGITLTSEKDIIFIVSRTAQKNDIMQAIVKDAGPDSRARTVVFSLPVTDTAGLRLSEETEE